MASYSEILRAPIHLHDPVVLEAVNDIESLTSDLSRKIWQKITVLGSSAAAPAVTRTDL